MIATLLAPFAHGFVLEAISIGTVVAVACALLSCFIVLKGWSLLGDAISHAVLPGWCSPPPPASRSVSAPLPPAWPVRWVQASSSRTAG